MAAEQPDALFHIDEDATLYELLGVTPDVGIAEIKQAYKKQALRWHPDKCTEPNAEDVFKRINTAYGVLSEDSKRAEYDHSLSCGSNPSFYLPPDACERLCRRHEDALLRQLRGEAREASAC